MGQGSECGPGDHGAEWDVEEPLTRLSFRIHIHLKRSTVPDQAELAIWWNDVLVTQVAMAALLAECGERSGGDLNARVKARMDMTFARVAMLMTGSE